MKKNSITLLLIWIVSSLTIFASEASDQFDVTTDIGGILEIKLVDIETNTNGLTYKSDFYNLTSNNDAFIVNNENYVERQRIRQVVIMSNSPSGYYMTLSATAMKADMGDYYINYRVSVGGAGLTTDDATEVTAINNIIEEEGPFTGMQFASRQVIIDVIDEDYEGAVAGSYSGTITFNLFTN